MKIHEAKATWKGNPREGRGRLEAGGTTFEYDFDSRFGDGPATTPEGLLGAAHAGCFSMALSQLLADEGYEPRSIRTRAEVQLVTPEHGDPAIERIDLITIADVPGIDAERFGEQAERAKQGCILSRAVAATKVGLDAKLAN
jgi:osmotically inducible protein OsmC